ncbi:hypothetical protein ABZV60_16885 [Streptomyces sp. NPDC004787]|uniref:hypothetical protein n=1 Tax=Streptomyces sp. NPDC004787 TaxID=3154291 RepID=UPI0033B95A4B
MAQHEIDTGVAAGVTSDQCEDVKQLREVNEALQLATAFFAGELDPRTADRGFHRPNEGSRSCRRVGRHRPEHRRTENRGTNLYGARAPRQWA